MKITLRSEHRNRQLALRKAARLATEYDGLVRVFQFNKAGRPSKRGTSFTFVIETKQKRKMWRLTVSVPIGIRKQGKKRKNESPEFKEFVVRGWFRTKGECMANVRTFKRIAQTAIRKMPRTFIVRHAPNVEIEQVKFDPNFLNLQPETRVE